MKKILLTGALTILVGLPAWATDGTWVTDGNGTWNTAANWSSNTTVAGGAGSTVGLTLNITANRTVTIDNTSATVGTLNIGDPTTGFFAYTLAASGGASLIMDNSVAGAVINHTATGLLDKITAPVLLNDNLTVNNLATTTAGNFAINGTITSNGTKNITLNSSGLGTITLTNANNTGTITNSGAGTATNVVTTVGTNVTGINQSSTTSALTLTTLNVNSGGTTLTNTAGTKILTVTSSVAGTGNLTLNNNSVLAAGITLTGGANNTGSITNSGNSTGTTTIAGVIGTNVNGGVIQNGAGTLAINGNNTFTSGLTVTNGTVSSSQAGATGFGNGAISLGNTAGGNSDNATILYTGSSAAMANTIAVNAGSSGILSIRGQTNSATFTGNITLNNALTLAQLTAARATTFSGAITGSSAINIGNTGISNNGTVILSNAGNSFGGGTTINSGTLEIGGAGTLGGGSYGDNIANSGTINFNTTASHTLSGTVSGTGAFKQSGAGTLTLTGTNTFTGATTIGTGAGALILSGTSTLNSGNYSGAITNNSALVYESSADQILGGAITGTGSITKNGTGRLTLTANSGYTGGVTLNSGTLGLDNSSGTIGSLGGTGSVLTINGGTIDSTAATARSFTNNQIWNADLVYAGSGGVAITFTGNVTLTASRSVNVVSGGAPTVTLGGVISEGGSGYGLTIEGAGTVVMQGTGTNTYTGNTTLNAAGLQLRTSNKLADASSIIVNSGRLDLTEPTGTQETVANVTVTGGYISASVNATMNKLTATNGFNFQNADAPISANLGGGNITKTTGGTVTLSGNNTNTGTLSVDGGKLIFVKPSALYSGANASWTKPNITVNSGGTLAFTAAGTGEFTAADLSTLIANLTGDVTTGGLKAGSTIGIGTSNAVIINNAISDTTGTDGGAVGLYKYGTNGLSLTGNNTYTGDTTIGAGTLTIGVGGTLGGGNYAGNILIGNTASLYVNPGAGGIQTLSGNISGNGGLRVGAGSPTVTLSGNNSYSGGTTLDTSTTVAMNKNAFGTGTIGVGSSQAPTISAGADLSGPNAIMNNVSMLGSFSLAGSNNATLGGSITLNNNRSITISNNATVLLSGPIHLTDGSTSGNLTLSFSLGSGPTTISNVIDDAGTAKGIRYSFTTGAMLKLTNGNSSYTGATDGFGTASGVLEVSKLANGNSNSSIGASTSDASNLVIAQSSTLRYVGGGDSTDRLFTLNGGSSTGNTLDASGTGAINFTNNGTLVYGGTANANRTLTLTGNNTGANTLSPAIDNNGNGTVALTKSGTGTWVLGGANTYNGTTTVNDGTLVISGTGAINSSSGVAISGSSAKLRYDSSVAMSRNVTVTSGGTFAYSSSDNYTGALTLTNGKLGGTNWNGNLSGLTIGTNQAIAPGNSVGTSSTSTQTWANNGSYDWEINKADGIAGDVSGGWDLFNLTGALTLSATNVTPFSINVISLGLNNLSGPATGFSDGLSYNWLIADAGSAISGFDANKFTLDVSGFQNPFTGAFGIELGNTGSLVGVGTTSQLYLTYTAIPEPSTWALLAFSLTTVMVLRRRRNS